MEFPSDDEALDEDAESLILSLLRKDPNVRLGAGGGDLFVVESTLL